MKALFRAFGMIVVGVYFTLSLMTLGQMVVIETELNDSVSYAMTATQIAMREQIEDRYYNTHNSRKVKDCPVADPTCDETKFETSEEYYTYFVKKLSENKVSKGTNYDVKIYAADIEKGLLSVEVTAYYTRLDGSTISDKAPKCRKIGIVDVVLE